MRAVGQVRAQSSRREVLSPLGPAGRCSAAPWSRWRCASA